MLLEAPRLSTEVIERLVRGEALAARVPGYCPDALCRSLASPLAGVAAGYQRIYRSNVPAFTETVGDDRARRDYLRRAATAMADVRDRCAPYASPVDRLRCELDELWPGGCRLLRFGYAPMVFGMVRIWRDGAEALPHLDVLGRAAPAVPAAADFTEQLGVNIFLRVPPAGRDGLIEIWDSTGPAGGSGPGGYGYPRESLPEPAVAISPALGDLILLRSTRIHAVRPTSSGDRVTLSGFIGHVDRSRPLLLWS